MGLTRFVVVLALAILLASIAGKLNVQSYRTLPVHLRQCYTNGSSFVPSLPLNLQVVLDILRKIERRTYSNVPLRILSAVLLKRFKLDGIVYSEHLPAAKGVLRYTARGSQRAKHQIVERLIPSGDRSLVEEGLKMLRPDELCLLHLATSNSIWQRFEASEEEYCKPGPSEKLDGTQPYRSLTGEPERCPKETGLVYTPYGSVALGSVLAATAAALQPQLVETRLLLEDDGSGTAEKPGELEDDDDGGDGNEDQVDFVVNKASMNGRRSMWLQTVAISNTKIDNVWIATIAGELAELAIYQGPLYENRMFLGATGFWNNTIRPRVFYFSHTYDHFDVTRAEILGGIDGLIIAKNINQWLNKFGSLRLSQVLDMYYSEKGVVFDKNIKACKRGELFPLIGPTAILEEQTYAASQVLAYLNSIAAMSEAALQHIVVNAVDHFVRYTNDHLFKAVQCGVVIPRRQISPVELLLAFDGAWTPEYTTDFLAALVGDFDVSMYGSRMGIVHGESGEWLLPVTSSPSNAHYVINNLKNIQWPDNMRLHVVFENILAYMDATWKEKRENRTIGDMGQAVVLLVPQIRMTDADVKLALDALTKIKSRHPETYFLYYGYEPTAPILQRFLLSDEDQIVTSLNVDDISRLLSKVPKTLRPVGCNPNIPGVRLQLEDYIYPSESNVYRLHPKWRIKTKKVVVTLHGVGYGTMKVCWWNQKTNNGKRYGTYCKSLPLRGDVTLTDYNTCDENNDCPNTYIEVMNVTTLSKCTEIECKTPDQVRYIVRMENFQCNSSRSIYANVLFIIFIVIFNIC